LIIVDGDTVNFLPAFTPAMVVVQPGKISSSAATTTVGGKGPCLEGDEKGVEVSGCQYSVVPAFPIPGTGKLKIKKLNSDQLTQTTTIEGKKVLLLGTMFDAEFTPDASPNSASVVVGTAKNYDSAPNYSGKGQFVASNQVVFAS
jgi:hypothetical protein